MKEALSSDVLPSTLSTIVSTYHTSTVIQQSVPTLPPSLFASSTGSQLSPSNPPVSSISSSASFLSIASDSLSAPRKDFSVSSTIAQSLLGSFLSSRTFSLLSSSFSSVEKQRSLYTTSSDYFLNPSQTQTSPAQAESLNNYQKPNTGSNAFVTSSRPLPRGSSLSKASSTSLKSTISFDQSPSASKLGTTTVIGLQISHSSKESRLVTSTRPTNVIVKPSTPTGSILTLTRQTSNLNHSKTTRTSRKTNVPTVFHTQARPTFSSINSKSSFFTSLGAAETPSFSLASYSSRANPSDLPKPSSSVTYQTRTSQTRPMNVISDILENCAKGHVNCLI